MRDLLHRARHGLSRGFVAVPFVSPGGFRRFAGQDLMAGLGDHQRASLRLETGDQADFALRSAHLVPRQPKTVRMPQLGLAVVFTQLFRGEDVLLIRRGIGDLAGGLVEGEDRKGPVDQKRLLVLVVVEHHAAAEPTDRRQSFLGQCRESPQIDHPRGDLGLRRGTAPGRALARSNELHPATAEKSSKPSRRQEVEILRSQSDIATSRFPWFFGHHQVVQKSHGPNTDETRRENTPVQTIFILSVLNPC